MNPVPDPRFPPAIVLANEPLAYRQALGAALRDRHADMRIIVVAPEDLEAAVARYRPVLVICDALTPAVEQGAPVWVLLYPEGSRLVVTSVHGARRYHADLSLEALSGLLHEALGPPARRGEPV